LLGTVVSLTGCADATSPDGLGPDEDDEFNTSEHQIEGGQQDTSHTAVVGLLIDRGRGGGICTGTLVTPNLVLTARHCIAEMSSDRMVCGRSDFTGTFAPDGIYATTDGTDITQRRPDDVYRTEELHVPKPDGVCGNDIALVELRRPIPSSAATPRAPRLKRAASYGETYTAIGYGVTGDGTGSGTRRRLEGVDVVCVGSNCRSRHLSDKEFAGDGGVCQGDSGGGAYGSSGKVFGIASRADRDCDRSFYTRVYPWRDWLTEIGSRVAGEGSYPVPNWVNVSDRDDDGIADSDDNCSDTENTDQTDTDDDERGDVCDSDIDGDGVPNEEDNCPKAANSEQKDLDGDGEGDACDRDRDGDGVSDGADNCPTLRNPELRTSGSDGSCKDSDGDGVADVADNCPETANSEQKDSDDDGTGDACVDGSDEAGGGTGSSTGGSGSDDDSTPIRKPDDGDGSATRSTCSAAGADRSSAPLNFALAGLFVVGALRVRRAG